MTELARQLLEADGAANYQTELLKLLRLASDCVRSSDYQKAQRYLATSVEQCAKARRSQGAGFDVKRDAQTFEKVVHQAVTQAVPLTRASPSYGYLAVTKAGSVQIDFQIFRDQQAAQTDFGSVYEVDCMCRSTDFSVPLPEWATTRLQAIKAVIVPLSSRFTWSRVNFRIRGPKAAQQWKTLRGQQNLNYWDSVEECPPEVQQQFLAWCESADVTVNVKPGASAPASAAPLPE